MMLFLRQKLPRHTFGEKRDITETEISATKKEISETQNRNFRDTENKFPRHKIEISETKIIKISLRKE